MSMIVVGSVRSGGATTLALAVAGWLDSAVLVEADADGGVLALRYGLSREPGLVTLAATRDVTAEAVLDHAQRLPGGLAAVVAPESPERAAHVIRSAGARLASQLEAFDGVDVVIDAGRLGPSSPSLCFALVASATVVVARPRAEELVAGAERVASLGSQGASAGLVLVGSGPYSAEDVTAQLGCPVIGTVADDPRAALALAEGSSGKGFDRSALARTARPLAIALTQHPGTRDARINTRSEVLA